MRRKAIYFVLGLVTGVVLALGVAFAQQPKVLIIPPPEHAQIVTGNDLAVRIQGRHGKRVVGTLMTKVDGKWVEVEFATYNALAK